MQDNSQNEIYNNHEISDLQKSSVVNDELLVLPSYPNLKVYYSSPDYNVPQ